MVCCLVRASESRLLFRLDLIKSWIQSAVQYCREQFVQRGQRTDRAVVSNIFHFSFFVTFIVSFRQASGVNSFCFTIPLKICLTTSIVSSSHALMSSALIPLLSADLPLSLLIAVCNSSVVISGILIISLVSLFCTSMLLSCSFSSFFLFSIFMFLVVVKFL